MRYAEELDEQWRDPARVMPSHRWPAAAGPQPAGHRTGARPGRCRIRYAYGGVPPQAGPWAAAPSATEPRGDLWVLVCGGIAAVAAFAAAFVASGGAVGHAATPQTATHSVTIMACPSAAPGR